MRKLTLLSCMIALMASTFLLSCCNEIKCSDVSAENIIPRPTETVVKEGIFTIKPGLTIGTGSSSENLDEITSIASYFNSKISPATGYSLDFKNGNGDINLIIDPQSGIAKEGYKLNASSKGVTITASTGAGVFYGIQSLLQLMPKEVKSTSKVESIALDVPYCEINDAPEFAWRGLMLDVSRHWFTKDEVKRYIDQLAEYKMNKFHWHLTDDQGWRIEIKSRPELTQKGALRAERVGQWWQREPQKDGEEATYGGYYTQEDIKEVLAYAAERYVTVVPEIDVPGHSVCALAAYPELACFKAPEYPNVGNKFYTIDENSLCPGNPGSYKLMEDVLTEVASLFPGEYIHIGGDECWKGFWAKCPKCKALMKKENLADVNGLQSYFIREMEKILKKNGKKLIGWDEIHEGGLAPEATVMSWRGIQGGIDAAKQGHHVIMTPAENCYIDLYQGDPAGEPDTYSMCRLSDSYNFNPVPAEVSKEMILGGQGNLWAESVPTIRHAEYMTWPRGWALAEVFWSGEKNKNWDNFVSRVEKHFERADLAEINHATSMYNPIVTSFEDENGVVNISLSSEINGLDIYYTFDNTNPDKYTPKYSTPLTIPEGATWLKAVTYRDGKKIGKDLSWDVKKLKADSKGKSRPIGNLTI